LALRRKPESEQIKQQIGHMLGARRSTGRIRNVLYQKIAGKGQKAPAPSSQWENYPKNWLWKILAASRTRRRYGAGCSNRQHTRRIRNVEKDTLVS